MINKMLYFTGITKIAYLCAFNFNPSKDEKITLRINPPHVDGRFIYWLRERRGKG